MTKCYTESRFIHQQKRSKGSSGCMENTTGSSVLLSIQTLHEFSRKLRTGLSPQSVHVIVVLYHQKLFICTNQEIQTNKYSHGKRSKHMEVGKLQACPIILESIAKLFGARKAARQDLYRRDCKIRAKLAAGDKGKCFNCVQTMWASRREHLDYHMTSISRNKNNEHLYGAYYVPAFGLDNNLQCSDDHLYLRYILKCTLHIHKHTHIYTYIYFIYNIYVCIYIPV